MKPPRPPSQGPSSSHPPCWPRVPWVGEEWHPEIATPENVEPPPYYPEHRITREEWARYLNSVSGMDIRVGWVLEQLRKDGLADNTVIMFFADNGRLEPRGIHWCWDSGLHVPLIVNWPDGLRQPKHYKPGMVDKRVISLLDLTATTMAIAGIERPFIMQSRVFLGAHQARRVSKRYRWSRGHGGNQSLSRLGSPRTGRKY